MESKEELIKIVKEWINLNNEIIEMQKKIKSDKAKKLELSNVLISIMNQNQVECFETQSGKLLCKKTKTKSAINNKHLIATLSEYFKDDHEINISNIVTYIDNRRETRENSKLVIK